MQSQSYSCMRLCPSHLPNFVPSLPPVGLLLSVFCLDFLLSFLPPLLLPLPPPPPPPPLPHLYSHRAGLTRAVELWNILHRQPLGQHVLGNGGREHYGEGEVRLVLRHGGQVLSRPRPTSEVWMQCPHSCTTLQPHRTSGGGLWE